MDSIKGKESLTSFTFSEKAKVVLQELFIHYPPADGEVGKKLVERHAGKSDKIQRKRDDIFGKPSMNKSEIAKKMEDVKTRMNKAANLRKVLLTYQGSLVN